MIPVLGTTIGVAFVGNDAVRAIANKGDGREASGVAELQLALAPKVGAGHLRLAELETIVS